MNIVLQWFLLVLFLAHLAGFTVLGMKRRELYYLALCVTFALLSASFAAGIFAPDWQAAGVSMDRWLRYAAWIAAAGSLTWTAARRLKRQRED